MKTIAVTNQKGGSGKTTTAVNVAAAPGEQGHRVLLLDFDPQASASACLGSTNADRGLLGVFADNVHLADLVRRTHVPNVDIVPASTWLVGVEKALASEVGSETLLRQAFGQLEDSWAYVLVDCPPTLGFLSVAALVACQAILVPVETKVMALGGLAALIRTVELVRERLNSHLRLSGIIACRVDLRTNLSRTILVRLRERFGDLVLQNFVRENIRLAEAPSFEQPITVYAPESTGAADYRAVAAEFLQRERTGVEYEQAMVADRG